MIGRCMRVVTAAAVALGLVACGGGAAHRGTPPAVTAAARPSQGVPRLEAQFAARSTAMYEQLLQTLVRHGAYNSGVWHGRAPCWRCGTELGAVAAILAASGASGHYAQWATETVDATLENHQLPSGAFGPPPAGDQIATGAELVTLGTIYLELQPQLSAPVKARWRAALDSAGRWLVGKLGFYVNGNINLQETLGEYLAWRVTGDPVLGGAYRKSFAFTLRPGPTWPGYGLVFTDGSGTNTTGYLAEKGAGAPGYDTHYTVLQADYAAELYAVSHDPRALRLLRLLFNQLLRRVHLSTLFIQEGGGSRHTAPSAMGHWGTCALPVVAFATHSQRLLKLSLRQLGLLKVDFINYAKSSDNQDQVIGNYAAALLALHPPA